MDDEVIKAIINGADTEERAILEPMLHRVQKLLAQRQEHLRDIRRLWAAYQLVVDLFTTTFSEDDAEMARLYLVGFRVFLKGSKYDNVCVASERTFTVLVDGSRYNLSPLPSGEIDIAPLH